MKKILLSMACLMAVLALSAQSTAKKFVLNLTADGESNLTCYLPQNPSGRAVVDCPGGGYSHLALNHEGYDWAEYFNKQGIAFCAEIPYAAWQTYCAHGRCLQGDAHRARQRLCLEHQP